MASGSNRRFGFLSFCLAAAAIGCGEPHASAAAQVATPAAPAAVTCDVAPRRAEDVLALVPPPRGGGTPAPGRPVLALPTGAPADSATTAAIAATVRGIEACANAGDVLRFLSYVSDDLIRRTAADAEAVAALAEQSAATPTPIPAGQRALFLGPWHVERLSDGRVLAAVVWFGNEADPAPDPDRTRALILVERDGRWLVDDLIEKVAAPGCPFSVPVATAVGPPPGVDAAAWPTGCG